MPPIGLSRRWVPSGLTGTLFGFLIGASALAGLSGVLYMGVYGSWSDWDSGGPTTAAEVLEVWESADAVFALYGLAFLVSTVLMLVWSNYAYKAADSRGATMRRWSSGWTVGGWFIPFANVVIPKLVMNEIDRMSSDALVEPIGDRWRDMRRSQVSDWWWGLYVPGSIVLGVTSRFVDDEAGGWLAATAVGLWLITASGILLAIFVRKLGRRLQQPRTF